MKLSEHFKQSRLLVFMSESALIASDVQSVYLSPARARVRVRARLSNSLHDIYYFTM